MKETQTQRRFLIPTDWQHDWLERVTVHGWMMLEDGYLETSDASVMRVRIEGRRHEDDPRHAFLTCKTGNGLTRQLAHYDLATEEAGIGLRAQWPYRLHKTRNHATLKGSDAPIRLNVDRFHGALDGIMIIETDDPRFAPEPREAIDVTDSLTNFHLARLAHELTQRAGDSPIEEALRLTQRLPRIVLTGGPCSGKSTVMATLKAKFGDQLHCVPEVATIVIGQVGVKPWTGGPRNMLSAQRLMYRAQRAFEDASDSQARTDGKSAMLLDRGVGDIGAYLPGGITDIEHLVHTTVAHEFARYDLVIVLDLPSETVYEANRANNSSRTETYDKAQVLANGIRRAWSTHPNYRFVADTALWTEKEATVVSLVENFLRTPRP